MLVDAAAAAGAECPLRRHRHRRAARPARPGRRASSAATAPAGAVAVDAGLVVGADGMRSAVARHVAAPVERRGTGASAVVYGYWSELDDRRLRVDLPARRLRRRDPDQRRAGLRLRRGAARRASAAAGAPVLGVRARAGVPRDGRSRAGRRRRRRACARSPASPGSCVAPWGPGWALVGDAGYWKDPLSAHGLTDALRDAELLARAVAAVGGGRVEPSTRRSAAYQAARDRLSLPLFTITDTIAAQRWTDAEIGDLLLQLSSAMADEVDALAALDPVAAA